MRKLVRWLIIVGLIAMIVFGNGCASVNQRYRVGNKHSTGACCSQHRVKKVTKHASAKKYKSKIATGKW